MAEVIKINGNAGTGKTTLCLDKAEKEINDGLDPNNLVYLTYTKGAAHEARERMAKRLNRDPDDMRGNWKTIHSLCFKLLSLSRSNAGIKHRPEFCDELDLEYRREVESAGPTELDFGEEPFGNKIFSAYDLMRSTGEEIDHTSEGWKKIFDNVSRLDRDPIEIMNLWEKYKIDNDIVDFVDMLSGTLRVGLVPDSRVMIVDEFQDMSNLDHQVYKLWRDEMERVYIAGSVPQTIYSFRGAHPKFFYNEDEDERIDRVKSWRVPQKICEEANEVLKEMSYLKSAYSELEPTDRTGEFEIRYADTDTSQLEEGMFKALYGDSERNGKSSWDGYELLSQLEDAVSNGRDTMALFRTRFQASDFRKRLLRVGIPFRSMRKNNIWTDRLVRLRGAIVDLYNGEEVRGQKKRAVGNLLDDSIYEVPKSWKIDEAASIIKDRSGMEKSPDSRTLLEKEYPLNWYQARALVENLERDKFDMDPDLVRVGTKHSSKGKEAEVVLTSFDTSTRIGVNQYTNTRTLKDEERRVDYVAITRASEKLFIDESAWDGIPNHTLASLKGESSD